MSGGDASGLGVWWLRWEVGKVFLSKVDELFVRNASSSDEVVTKPTKKAKVAAAGEAATDADGNTYWAVR